MKTGTVASQDLLNDRIFLTTHTLAGYIDITDGGVSPSVLSGTTPAWKISRAWSRSDNSATSPPSSSRLADAGVFGDSAVGFGSH
ncbi:hypothetical protein [Halalkalicoccus salilacus]|uniref:hypothetical protein n=1 Tax=Halalkalicoccus TaxID=332246 RepID=UPI002F96400A